MASRRSTLRCASCRATYWSVDAHGCAPAKPRRWRKVGPHEYTLRMGPVTVELIRMPAAAHENRDEWTYQARIFATHGGLANAAPGGFVGVARCGKGAPLAQCQANAIAAVEAWRDSIR